MENKNKKNFIPIDIDKICLKDHLNASFDNDNIKVSEELIARTLQAINKDELLKEYQPDNKKKHKFPIRRFVSAAAVLLVLFVGIKILQNNTQLGEISLGSKSSDTANNTESSVVSDTAAVSGLMRSNQTDVTETETPIEETDKALSVKGFAANVEATSADEDKPGDAFIGSTSLFSELYPFSADQIVFFSMTKKNPKLITVVGNAEKSREFYSLLDEYILLVSEKDISETWNYKVEIETEKDQTYTILVGDGIQLRNEDDPKGTFAYYAIENADTLIKSMDEFYKGLQ